MRSLAALQQMVSQRSVVDAWLSRYGLRHATRFLDLCMTYPATGLTVFLEPQACLEMNNEIRLLEAAERREVERILREATASVRSDSDALKTNLQIAGKIDLLQAIAMLAEKMGAVVPGLNTDRIVDIRSGRNPALLLCQDREVVPLDLELGRDHETLIITGPNAGGKTVAMKTVGLLTLMVSCGIPVPVLPSSSFSLFDTLVVEIGDEQSIEHDLSTFSSRVRGLRRMAELANPGALILIDEIGTGTDPEEGAALAQAMLERLTRAGARSVVTTHHGMLKAFAHNEERVANGSMEFDVGSLRPTFRFRQGIPGSSYAFRIADSLNLDSAIVARARELRGLESTRLESLMELFEKQNQDLKRQLDKPPEPVSKPKRKRPGRRTKTTAKKTVIAATTESLKAGDRVVMEGGSVTGEVLSVGEGKALVEFGSMRVRTRTSRLALVGGPKQQSRPRKPNFGKDAKPFLDLRGSRVEDALKVLEEAIDKAHTANLPSVEILHGKGTGALRDAVHKYLENSIFVTDFSTPPANTGITYVKLSKS